MIHHVDFLGLALKNIVGYVAKCLIEDKEMTELDKQTNLAEFAINMKSYNIQRYGLNKRRFFSGVMTMAELGIGNDEHTLLCSLREIRNTAYNDQTPINWQDLQNLANPDALSFIDMLHSQILGAMKNTTKINE